jgi:hypothetical protein
MANLIRLAKSGNDWSTNKLMAYNISVVERDQNTFNGPLPAYTSTMGFVQYKDFVQGLDVSLLALTKHLDLTMKVMDGQESTVDHFTAEVLWALGYETKQVDIHTQMNI